MGQHARMADSKFVTVRFTVKEFTRTTKAGDVEVEDVGYCLALEPKGDNDFDGDFIGLNLPFGISEERANEICEYFQRNVRGVSYTKFGAEDEPPKGGPSRSS
jgi:hypothetical protein